jgi:hypothetical protein
MEIPNSSCYTFRDPTGNHIAIYENKRPNVMTEFKGQIDNHDSHYGNTEMKSLILEERLDVLYHIHSKKYSKKKMRVRRFINIQTSQFDDAFIDKL